MNINGKRVYVSGPITGRADHNVAAFAVAQSRLRDAGAEYVFNPTHRAVNMHPVRRAKMTHEEWMLDCIHELTDRKKRSQGWEEIVPRKYDVLVLLPGWQDSAGATRERAVAIACGIEVCELDDALNDSPKIAR